MRKVSKQRPLAAWIQIILLFFLGLGGIISGAMLFLSPDGHLIGMSTSILLGSPFPNFLIPGIILFLFVGVFQTFTGWGLLTRTHWNVPNIINPFKKFHWSWTASWAAGCIMLIWIIVETILLGYVSFLQPLITIWAIVLIILAWLPSVRHHYRYS